MTGNDTLKEVWIIDSISGVSMLLEWQGHGVLSVGVMSSTDL